MGAIYWTGLRRLVCGISQAQLKAITGNRLENPTLDLNCRVVIAAGQHRMEVIGPLPEHEAAVVQGGLVG